MTPGSARRHLTMTVVLTGVRRGHADRTVRDPAVRLPGGHGGHQRGGDDEPSGSAPAREG